MLHLLEKTAETEQISGYLRSGLSVYEGYPMIGEHADLWLELKSVL